MNVSLMTLAFALAMPTASAAEHRLRVEDPQLDSIMNTHLELDDRFLLDPKFAVGLFQARADSAVEADNQDGSYPQAIGAVPVNNNVAIFVGERLVVEPLYEEHSDRTINFQGLVGLTHTFRIH
jgi:hypothetical protein